MSVVVAYCRKAFDLVRAKPIFSSKPLGRANPFYRSFDVRFSKVVDAYR